MTLTGESRSTRSKPRTNASFSTKNFTRTDPWSNPRLRNEKPATDRLSHGQQGLSPSSLFPSSSFFSFLFSSFFFYYLLLYWTVLPQCQPIPLPYSVITQTAIAGTAVTPSASPTVPFTNLWRVAGRRQTLKATAVMSQPTWAREVQMAIRPVGMKTPKTTMKTPRLISTKSRTTPA